MALKDKLGALTQKVETEKQEKKSVEQTAELKPVRANIKKLDKEKKSLEILKGSLDFEDINNPADHEGMKDYALNTDKKIKKEDSQLEGLMNEHKEALASVGVETKEQLMTNPEFSEEEEVVNYKKALKRGEGLKLSDDKLKEKLAEFGIEIDDEKFSYERASQQIGKKLELVNQELTQEKLKTPEGKEEFIGLLAEEFSKETGNFMYMGQGSHDKIHDAGFNRDKEDSYYNFDFKKAGESGSNNLRFKFFGDKTILEDYYKLKAIPDSFENKKYYYGKEIANAALEKNFQNKIHEEFAKIDKRDHTTFLRSQLDSISPEENNRAQKTLVEFEVKQNEFLSIIKEKSEELKAKGIDFSPDYASNYGAPYEEIIGLEAYSRSGTYRDGGVEDLFNELNKNSFPPKYDFKKLQKIIASRLESLSKLIEVVKNLKTEEDVNDFLSNGKSDIYVGNFAKQAIKTDLQAEARFEFEKGSNIETTLKLMAVSKSYNEALDYLDKKINESNQVEKRISDKVKEIVQYQINLVELKKLAVEEGVGDRPDSISFSSIESFIRNIETNKQDASDLMKTIINLQAELPQDEELHFGGSYVSVPSFEKKAVDLEKEIEVEEKKLQDKIKDIDNKKSANPWFGKDKLKRDLENSETEKISLEEKITRLREEKDEARKKKYYSVGTRDEYSEVGKMKNIQRANGKANEIFNDLRKELSNFIDKEVPVGLVAKYNEFKSLEAKLSGKE
ncbi:MAG: hypothetical protein ACOYL8_02355 [Patescibacteria group bacterium]